MASIIIVLLLIAGVVFILGQTMGIVGTRSGDTNQQADSTAALMLAESGLQRAQAIVATTASAGLMSEAACTGIAAGGPFALGRGSFSYGTPVASPASCSYTGTACESCTVPVTGTVNTASRSLSLSYQITQSYGVAGTGQTVTMMLKNINPVPAVALFHLGWQRQGPGGNANAAICPTCGNRWTVESSSGSPSVGAMGVSVDIAPLTYSQLVTQNLSLSRNFVEAGALFPATTGSASAPTLVGSYWNDAGGGTGTKTVNTSGSVGQVNSGVVAAVSGTCAASPGAGTAQSCNSWCYGGDTLVYGFAGRSTGAADQLSGVTFNTSGTPAQSVPLTRIVHFPAQDGSTANASNTIYSEIWYAYNPDYMSAGTGAGLSSYPSSVKASAGTTITLAASMSNGNTIMPVASMTSNTQLCIGDTLTSAGGITGSAITATPGGACSSAAGNYTVSPAAGGNVNAGTNPVATSSRLYVQGSTGANLAAGATNNALVAISSGPDGSGNYTLTTARNLPPTYVTQGVANASTVFVPSGAALPSVGTRVAVHSTGSGGTGVLPAGTLVSAVGSGSFTLGTAATTPLVGATLCGGTCAFFDGPSSTSSVTSFSVTASAGTSQWGSGFACLKGVDASVIAPVTSSKTTAGRWQESVQ